MSSDILDIDTLTILIERLSRLSSVEDNIRNKIKINESIITLMRKKITLTEKNIKDLLNEFEMLLEEEINILNETIELIENAEIGGSSYQQKY